MRSLSRKGRDGFTLIELLTVIAIIAILAALIMTAVMSAQESGKLAHCKNNLTQLNKMIYMYSTTYGGYLPAFWHGRWVGELGMVGYQYGNLPHDQLMKKKNLPVVFNNVSPNPYGSFPIRSGAKVLLCKSDMSGFRCDQGCFLSYMGLAKYGWWHRGRYIATISQPVFEYHQIQEFDNPTRRIMLVESEPGTWQYGGCGCRWHAYRHPVYVIERHYGGGNILFFDGHVDLVKDPEKRKIRYWEPDYDTVSLSY